MKKAATEFAVAALTYVTAGLVSQVSVSVFVLFLLLGSLSLDLGCQL